IVLRQHIAERPTEPQSAHPAFDVVVVATTALASVQRELAELRLKLLTGGAAALAVAVLLALAFGRRLLRPVEARARGARASGEGETVPMPDRGTGDEVDALAAVLGESFQRLRDARDRERRFAADASHELRTPVAIVQTAADVALRG